jgi:hypothetical protein
MNARSPRMVFSNSSVNCNRDRLCCLAEPATRQSAASGHHARNSAVGHFFHNMYVKSEPFESEWDLFQVLLQWPRHFELGRRSRA